VKQQTVSVAAWVTLFALATVWGGSFLAFALILREVPVLTIVAHRVLWAALFLWGLVFFMGLPRPDMRQWGTLIVMGFLNNVIPFSLIIWGQTQIESGLASILNGTTAIFTFLLAAMFFADERLTKLKTLGVIVAFLGVCVIIGIDALRNFNIQSLAQMAVIGACLSYTFAAVWARAKIKDLHPIMAASGMLTGACFIIIPMALWVDGVPSTALNLTTTASIAFLAIPATAIAYLLYYRALRLAGSSNLSLVTLLVPPMAVFWGWLVLGERLSTSAYAGFALIALGMMIIDGRLFSRKRR
jgi:drug/metabolite transporter (DMT)-like permease